MLAALCLCELFMYCVVLAELWFVCFVCPRVCVCFVMCLCLLFVMLLCVVVCAVVCVVVCVCCCVCVWLCVCVRGVSVCVFRS